MIAQALEVVGFGLFLAGLYLLAGVGWTLLAAGVLIAAAATQIEVSE